MSDLLVVLGTPDQWSRDIRYITDHASPGDLLKLSSTRRTLAQNSKLWVLLNDVARSKPHGHVRPPEDWKFILLNLMGQEMQYMEGLDGKLFAIGYNTSRFNKQQMSDFIEFIYKWGAENGVEFSI